MRCKVTLFLVENKIKTDFFAFLRKKSLKKFAGVKYLYYLCTRKWEINHLLRYGAIAQLVEQRTENPCVPGSIPGGTTSKSRISSNEVRLFC